MVAVVRLLHAVVDSNDMVEACSAGKKVALKGSEVLGRTRPTLVRRGTQNGAKGCMALGRVDDAASPFSDQCNSARDKSFVVVGRGVGQV